MEETFFAICFVLFVQILILWWFRKLFEKHSEEMKNFIKNLNEQKTFAVLHVGEVKND